MSIANDQLVGKARILAAICPYRERFNRLLQGSLHLFEGPKGLRQACIYAMGGEAKRLRPALTYIVAEQLGHGLDVSEAAIAVESLHAASLIADDLPCMDDDDYRRGRLTTHKAFDEATALLASYALISVAFESIARNSAILEESAPFAEHSSSACRLAVQAAAFNTGGARLAGGQFEDIHTPGTNIQKIQAIYQCKTAALFETALQLGWLFGGGNPAELSPLKEAARHLGTLFQLVDDLKDAIGAEADAGSVNNVTVLGLEGCLELARESKKEMFGALNQAGLLCEPLQEFGTGLFEMIVEGLQPLIKPKSAALAISN